MSSGRGLAPRPDTPGDGDRAVAVPGPAGRHPPGQGGPERVALPLAALDLPQPLTLGTQPPRARLLETGVIAATPYGEPP